MTSTTTSTEGARFRPHPCRCGCGHVVGRELGFVASGQPREDLVTTVEERIADAAAQAELEARRRQARLQRMIEEMRAAMRAAMPECSPRPSIDCPCCGCSFDPDEYRRTWPWRRPGATGSVGAAISQRLPDPPDGVMVSGSSVSRHRAG